MVAEARTTKDGQGGKDSHGSKDSQGGKDSHGKSEKSEGSGKQRVQALQSALGQIEKQFGKGSIMTLGGSERIQVEGISTGGLSLDLALGGQGIPRGRITEIYGPESSGKTTLCLHVISNAQKRGGVCAFIDAEHAFDAIYARKLGINLDELLVSQPDTGEQALEIAETLIRSNAVDVVVVDSVAALVPKAEIEGEMGDSHVGLQARLMSQALRKLSGAIRTSNAVMIFTNQIRMKIGVMFGNPETTTGGNALKFYASVRIDMRRIGQLKGPNDVVVGNRTRAKVVKNKIAPPFRLAEFDILFGQGIDRLGDLVDLATNASLIEKSGSWLSWKGQRLGQGREKAREFLLTQPDLVAAITQETLLSVAGKDGAGLPTGGSEAGGSDAGEASETEGAAKAATPASGSATRLGGGEALPPAAVADASRATPPTSTPAAASASRALPASAPSAAGAQGAAAKKASGAPAFPSKPFASKPFPSKAGGAKR
jgi:recombination protein RecA